jgi:transcriptional regulator with XRE-family HTH domain
MNWLQTIREHLNLSQEELAQYLAISVHMLQSVEQDRRQLPKESIKAAQEMYSAVKDAAARPLRIDPEPPTIEQIRRVGRLHRRYSRRLEQYTRKLEGMKAPALASVFTNFRFSLLTNPIAQMIWCV